ncbi:hypothetical protein VUR80DRAFT_1077 [Thermomyces stellatus]
MGGIVEARDRAEAPRGAGEAREERGSVSKGKTGKHGSGVEKTTKKRRKVNHACIYCRRSHMTCDLERPCTRCVKRNISHLCRDEPRDADSRKSKSVAGSSIVEEPQQQGPSMASNAPQQQQVSQQQQSTGSMPPPPFEGRRSRQSSASFGDDVLGQRGSLPNLVRQSPQGRMRANPLGGGNLSQASGFSDAWLSAQDQLNGLNPYHANYMIAPEVTDEFNLLENFLHASLLDDGAQLADALSGSSAPMRPIPPSDMLPAFQNNAAAGQNQDTAMRPPPPTDPAAPASRPPAGIGAPTGDSDKARREYYLQAADPSGNDTPEERMQRLLKAKYNAGLLKPFNYIKGYQRLSAYLDRTISTASKQKILRMLNQFRPKFREKAQALTDMELVIVEMWFEKQLMEYDRVFASMAVPACLWRRTGEIFRGNKEMAELIGVPVERLRDGRLALHEILTEESLVRYWEEFQTIAFDPDHDTLLTACSLKGPEDKPNEPVVNCAFSFIIKRDEYKLPTIIVGNFLPHDPPA